MIRGSVSTEPKLRKPEPEYVVPAKHPKKSKRKKPSTEIRPIAPAEGRPDIQNLFLLKPGEKAVIEVEMLAGDNPAGVNAAIACVDAVGKRAFEDYFKIIKIEKPV
jgi:hypothetical protein